MRAYSAILLLLCLAVVSCSGGDKVAGNWQAPVDALAQMTGALQLPQHLQQQDARKDGTEFDANQYFTVLPHLSMEAGYTLDYVYLYDGMGGLPMLYARPVDQPPYATYSEYTRAVGNDPSRSSYLAHVQTDGTPEGYFQLTVLSVMGGQFYLFWHANYNDAVVIASRDGLESLISSLEGWDLKLPDDVKRQARALKLDPVVEVQDDTVRVQVITFSKWSGFARETYVIKKGFPHDITMESQDILVPYDCGIMF